MSAAVNLAFFAIGVVCLVSSSMSCCPDDSTDAQQRSRRRRRRLRSTRRRKRSSHRKLMSYRDLLLDAKARMDLDRELDRLWSQP